jgi:hypothetical protein
MLLWLAGSTPHSSALRAARISPAIATRSVYRAHVQGPDRRGPGPVAKALTVLLEIHRIPCEVASGPEEAMLAVARGDDVVVQDMNCLKRPPERKEWSSSAAAALPDPGLPSSCSLHGLPRDAVGWSRTASDYLAKPWDDPSCSRASRTSCHARGRAARGRRALRRAALASRFDCAACSTSETMHRCLARRAVRPQRPV